MFRLQIVNLDGQLAAADFARTVAAIRRQVVEDFAPVWHLDATVGLLDVPPQVVIGEGIVYVQKTLDVAGALGYHTETAKGLPFGLVGVDVCAKYGEAWSTTTSHEVLELLGDPDVNLSVAGPHPIDGHEVFFGREVCDPVQGLSYAIDGVAVSDFVKPSWFRRGPAGPRDSMAVVRAGFGVAPGGYVAYWDPRTGRDEQWIPDAAAEHRRAVRAALGAALRSRRRHAS